ncbi:hypothetical protein M885DRAFT_618638 [Pelagophyceae sp. CCMP2097]|nr:hypothetical protein M885DRAFT_618638 [Pelagophyceae sp. CCMP2097]
MQDFHETPANRRKARRLAQRKRPQTVRRRQYLVVSPGKDHRGVLGAFVAALPFRRLLPQRKQATVKGSTPLMKLMRALDLKQKDASSFLRLFEEVDVDHSGTVEADEFFAYLQIDVTSFGRKAFDSMAVREKQVVKMLRYTFDLIDVDKSGVLSKSEVFDMVRLLATSDRDAQEKLVLLMNVLDDDGNGDVDFHEFARAQVRLSAFMFPALRLQRQMRTRCLGLRWWKKQSKKRKKLGTLPLQIYAQVMEWQLEKPAEALEELLDGAAAGETDEPRKLSEEEFSAIQKKAALVLAQLSSDQKEEWERIQAVMLRAHNLMDAHSIQEVVPDEAESLREGTWWSEVAKFASNDEVSPVSPSSKSYYESSKKDLRKTFVEPETAAALDAAAKARMRAKQLNDLEGERRIMLADFEKQKTSSVRLAPPKKGWCCCFRRTKLSAIEDLEDSDDAGEYESEYKSESDDDAS